jgi:hypothetical protein
LKSVLFLAPIWIVLTSLGLLVFPATSTYFQFALGFNLFQHVIYIAVFYSPMKRKKENIVRAFVSLSAIQFFSFLLALVCLLVLDINVMYLFHAMWIFLGILTLQVIQITRHLKLIEKPLD